MNNESKNNIKLPILIAIIGLLGTGIGASISGFFNIQLEQEKLRSSLILKAVETNDAQGALDFLKFLKETKLVDDLDLTIKSWEANPEQIPLRPTTEFNEGIFNNDRNTRRKTLQSMIDEDSDNPEQIDLVLETLEKSYFKSLTPQAKVNALFFLNKTNFSVWTKEMKDDGIYKISALKTLQLGPDAKGELKELEQNLNKN